MRMEYTLRVQLDADTPETAWPARSVEAYCSDALPQARNPSVVCVGIQAIRNKQFEAAWARVRQSVIESSPLGQEVKQRLHEAFPD